MNTYLVYSFSAYGCPKISIKEIQGSDIFYALQSSGLNYAEILSIKLKGVAEATVGL